MITSTIRRFAAVAVALCAAPAHAHDSWLLADRFDLSSPGVVELFFVTTDKFPVRDASTRPDRVASWTVLAPASDGGFATVSVRDPAAEEGALAGRFDATAPGVHTAALALKPRFIEIEPALFTEYLREERADAALGARERQRDQNKPGREIYTKLAKTFFRVSGAADQPAPDDNRHYQRPVASFGQPVGHTLEIIPLADPTALRAGDSLPVRVLLDGRPAQGLRVSSIREKGVDRPVHDYEESRTTNASGEASVRLPVAGLWGVRTHVMRACGDVPPDAQNLPAGAPRPDWESFFASITFEVAPR